MAITRAQQVRQMLEDGGMLVKPGIGGRRPGYRGDAAARSTGAAQSGRADPGRRSDPGEGRASDPGVSKDTGGFAPTKGQSAATSSDRFKDVDADKGRKAQAEFLLNTARGLSELRKRGVTQIPVGFPGSSVLNMLTPFRNFTLRKNIDYFRDLKSRNKNPGIQNYPETEQGYRDYMRDRLAGKIDAAGNLKAGFMRDASGAIMSTGNDGRDSEAEQLALLAQNQIPQSTAPTTTTSPLGGLAFRFLAEGGMAEDAPVGGIMDIESGRQMYFLGKLVKKATRAVKKIAKSPVGKAALLYAGGAGLGSLASGGGLGSLFKLGTYAPSTVAANFPKIFSGTGLKNILVGGKDFFGERSRDYTPFSGLFGKGGELSFGKVATFASLLPLLGLGTGDESEEEAEKIIRGSGLDIASIRNNPYTFTSSVGGSGLARRFVADGGRIGFRDGTSEFMDFVRSMGLSEDKLKQLDINSYNAVLQAFQRAKEGQKPQTEEKEMAEGGKAEPVAKDTMPLLKMGGKEMDLRDNGGFVPIGRMERADDVPARLSKNEFVFTADAVRNAGGGDIDKGAEVMYNMMQNLESGGEVSEESQGLKGAREMFQTSKRLEEVL